MPIGFITTLPSSSPDLIDEFTGTSLVTGSAGIGLTVNNNCTADAGGIDTGIDTANYLEWNTAFIRGANPLSYDLAGGFTMQWDMLVWPFTDVHGTQNLRAFFSMVGTASAALFRQTTSSSGIQLFENGGFAPAIRTFTDGYESTATDYGKLTTSYDPNRGDFGVIDIWLDYFLIMSVELGAVPDFSTALRLLNNTTTAMGALSRNFQLFRGATVPVATQNVSTVGDSFLGVWGAYQLGGDTNNSGAPILGFQGGDVYGGGENSVIPSNNFKNQSFLARLHKEMALKGIYPSGGIINNYGRGGARAYSASIPPTSTYPDSKTLLERSDALFAPTTSTVIPAPYGGQGTGVVDTLIIQIGTNDIAIAAVEGISLVTSLANLQTQLDSYIDDGVSSIILCNAPPLYTAGPTAPQHVAETTQWNAGVALLNGYGGVVVVVDINTNWLSTYLNSDGVHPNALGQAFWAEQVGQVLAAPVQEGLISNVSPVIYFDFTTGSGTTVVDSSPLLFNNPRGAGNPQLQRVAIPAAIDSVDTAAGYSSAGFAFDAAKFNAFELLAGDNGFSTYSEIFNGAGSILWWANYRVDTFQSGSGNNTLLSIRGKDGTEDSAVLFEFNNSGTGNSRLYARINNGVTGLATGGTDVGSISDNTTFFNQAVLIDTRTGQGTLYMTHSGSMQQSNTVSEGAFSIGPDSANLGFLIGADKVGPGPRSWFDGTIARMGCINFGDSPPDYITGAIQTLFYTDGIPDNSMDGF